MEEALAFPGAGDDDYSWKCQKHPSAQPTAGGVCPVCLRYRLLRLCPDCGRGRPCPCSCPSTSTASSSSSSLSSADLHRFGAAGAQVGAVGRVSHLIDCEPAFRRSRSAAFRLLQLRSEEAGVGGRAARLQAAGGRGGWSWLWPFQRGKKAEDEDASNAAAATATLSKSRSVGALTGACADSGAADIDAACGEAKPKGWNRYFHSPMKALRHQRSSKAAQARFPFSEVKEDTTNMKR